MQSDFDKAVRRNDPKTMITVHKQPKEQISSAQKILDDCEEHYALQEKYMKITEGRQQPGQTICP